MAGTGWVLLPPGEETGNAGFIQNPEERIHFSLFLLVIVEGRYEKRAVYAKICHSKNSFLKGDFYEASTPDPAGVFIFYNDFPTFPGKKRRSSVEKKEAVRSVLHSFRFCQKSPNTLTAPFYFDASFLSASSCFSKSLKEGKVNCGLMKEINSILISLP